MCYSLTVRCGHARARPLNRSPGPGTTPGVSGVRLPASETAADRVDDSRGPPGCPPILGGRTWPETPARDLRSGGGRVEGRLVRGSAARAGHAHDPSRGNPKRVGNPNRPGPAGRMVGRVVPGNSGSPLGAAHAGAGSVRRDAPSRTATWFPRAAVRRPPPGSGSLGPTPVPSATGSRPAPSHRGPDLLVGQRLLGIDRCD